MKLWKNQEGCWSYLQQKNVHYMLQHWFDLHHKHGFCLFTEYPSLYVSFLFLCPMFYVQCPVHCSYPHLTSNHMLHQYFFSQFTHRLTINRWRLNCALLPGTDMAVRNFQFSLKRSGRSGSRFKLNVQKPDSVKRKLLSEKRFIRPNDEMAGGTIHGTRIISSSTGNFCIA